MQTVLITGAGGFTGRHLTFRLEEAGLRPIPFRADLTDADAVRVAVREARPDYLIHLAAISFVPAGEGADVYRVNVIGSENLLSACADLPQPPKRLILASSANVYGRVGGQIGEERCPAPVNHYAASKLAMEHIAATWREQLEIVLTRPFNYTGRGQADHFLVPKLVAAYARRDPILTLGNIDIRRDFSDVRWVAEAYQRLLTAEIPPSVVNLGSGQSRALTDILAILGKLTGHQPETRQDPALMRRTDIPDLKADPARLRHVLPDLPPPIPLEETLAWMLK